MISAAIICRDNEALLARLLPTLQWAGEIVVVDTGSTDNSVQVALQHGARVEHFTWLEDFSAARNYALECCKGDWLMWADTKEVFSPEAQQQCAALKFLEGIEMVMTSWAWGENLTIIRERFIRASANLRWQGAIHECIAPPAGRTLYRPDIVIHRVDPGGAPKDPDRNLRILQHEVAAGNRKPRNLFYFGNELRERGRLAEAAVIYREYLKLPAPTFERFQALLHLANCLEGEAREKAIRRAVKLDPSRAEGWLQLARCVAGSQQWVAAAQFIRQALDCKRPSEGFVDETAYSEAWLRDHLATYAYHAGDLRRAEAETLRALEIGHPEEGRLHGNLVHYL